MEPTLTYSEVVPQDRWNYTYISPGPVGSVGDCLMTERHKRSNGEMFQAFYEYNKDDLIGSYIQDGQKSTGARVKSKYWSHNLKSKYGWIHQDVMPVDARTMEVTGYQPQYGWRNTVARVYKAATTGEGFLPVPNGYVPPEKWTPRGGLTPVTSVEGNVVSSSNVLNQRIYTQSGFNLGQPIDYSTTLGGLTFKPPTSTVKTT